MSDIYRRGTDIRRDVFSQFYEGVWSNSVNLVTLDSVPSTSTTREQSRPIFIEIEANNIDYIKSLYNYLRLDTDSAFIAGGSIKSLQYGRNDHDDVDIFVAEEEELRRLRAFFERSGSGYTRDNSVRNGYKYHNNHSNEVIQLLSEIGKTPLEVISHFDMSIIRAYYDGDEDVIVCSSRYQQDNQNKMITFEYVKELGRIMYRIQKYCQKGYKFNIYEFMKISNLLQEQADRFGIDISNYKVDHIDYESWNRFCYAGGNYR